MRLSRFLPALVVLALVVPLKAQQPSPVPPFGKAPPVRQAPVQPTGSQQPPQPRDPQALSVVQTAITALGGATAIGAIQTWRVQAQSSAQFNGATRAILWEQAGSEFRMASHFGTAGGDNVIVTGHGSPASVQGGTTKALPSHVISSLFIPALAGSILLNEFQNTNYTFQYVGTRTLNSKTVSVVRTVLLANPLGAQTWYFDMASGLPVRVEYRIAMISTPAASLSGAADLLNYQPVAGILYPFQIVQWRQGMQVDVVTLQSVNVNAAISSSDFDAAGGVQ